MLPRLRSTLKHLHRTIRAQHNMTTIHLSASSIPIHIPAHTNLTEPALLAFSPFKTWHNTLQHSLSQQSHASHPFHAHPYTLHSIAINSASHFGSASNPRLGFLKLTADVSNAAKESLPGVVLLRGPSVAMLVLLTPDDVAPGAEDYVVLTVQARVPAGALAFAELPAGMLDDAGSFAGAAAKEMEEELGVVVGEEELLDLTALTAEAAGAGTGEEDAGGEERLQDAMYTSPGGQDEAIKVFLYRKRVPRAQLEEWRGKLTGLREEGEKITLRLVRVEELWKVGFRDAKALGAWALYEGLKREGRV